jgi:TIR domain
MRALSEPEGWTVAHDVFISYSHHDKRHADAVCATLEAKGIRCWIAPRDVIAGQEWGEAIVDAIRSSRVMALVFSSHANDSPQIRREVQLAVSAGVVLIPFRIEDVAPAGSLEYFLGVPHWLDAMTPPFEAHLEHLAVAVISFLGVSPHTGASDGGTSTTSVVPPSFTDTARRPRVTRKEIGRIDPLTANEIARGALVDDLAHIGVAPLEGSDVPSTGLPEADRQALSGLAADRNVEEIVRRVALLFEWADWNFASSGATEQINKPSGVTRPRETDQRELHTALQLAGRGLGWIQVASQLIPTNRPQLREALGHADRLFYRIGWLTYASGYSTLGISRAFEDFADYLGNRHQETQSMLRSDSNE